MGRPIAIASQAELEATLMAMLKNNVIKSSYSRASWQAAIDKIIMPQPRSVNCLYFDDELRNVVLLDTDTTLESVSGRVKPGESPLEAARRVFYDTTTVEIPDWELFGTVNKTIYLFRAHGSLAEECINDSRGVVVAKSNTIGDVLKPNSHLNWLLTLAKNLEVTHVELNIPKYRVRTN